MLPITWILALAISSAPTQAQVVFSPTVNVSNNSGNSQGPQIAVDAKGNINMVWLDNSPGNFSVFFSRSSNGGATFSQPLNLSNNPGGSASGAQIGVDSNGDIYVAWFDTNSGSPSIFFRQSSDDGATFSSAINKPAVQGVLMSVDPAGKIYLVWAANDSSGAARLVFSRSLDEGTTFSNPLILSNASTNTIPGAVALDGSGGINVAWVEAAPPQNLNNIFFSRSVDGGATFSSPSLVTSSSGPMFRVAALGVDSAANIHVLWTTALSGQTNTYLCRSSDGGATFAAENFQSGVSDSQQSPQLALDSRGGLNIVWNSGGQNPVLNFARSADRGATFVTQTIEGGNFADPASATLATDSSGNINIVWTQGGGPSTPAGMMFTRSSDAGQTFSSHQQIAGTGGQNVATAVDSGGNIYAAWSQLVATGNGDIFFSRGTTPAPPPTATVSLASLSLNPSSVTGGNSSTGTITLTGPAPSGGVTVAVASSNSGVAVPAKVTVPGGSTSATFTVGTRMVFCPSQATISSTVSGVRVTINLAVAPPTSMPTSFCGGTGGGPRHHFPSRFR